MSKSLKRYKYIAAISGLLSAISLGGLPAVAAGSLYGVYSDTFIGYPAVLTNFDTSGAVDSNSVVGEYFGGGALAPLQYPLSGLTYGIGRLYGAYSDTVIGYPAVLTDFDTTGAVTANNVIGEYFGGGALAPLQYPLSGLAFGNGQLYGAYSDTVIGYPAVLSDFDTTGAITANNVIGEYLGGGALAPLQYSLSALAFGNGHLYGVYSDTDIGYPAVLADIDPSTGNVLSTNVIGEYFDGGVLAPLQFSLSALAFGDGHLYGVYSDTVIGYPAVLTDIDPLTGNVLSNDVIGEYFGGGTLAPLQYPISGLAFVGDAPTTVPEPGSLALFGIGLIALGARFAQSRGWSARGIPALMRSA